ncbi:MAG TPA: DUF305 domain-containing protein [Chryseolinea sp.]|nr:DUF305 domain-containing protein [Chryseolinea sp.]
MKNQATLYGIIGLLAGSLLTIIVASYAVNTSNTGMMQMMGMRQTNNMMREEMGEITHRMGMESSMDDMVETLKGKTGDEFDEAFIAAMIPHHQGAIEMAKEAKSRGDHQEILDLADNIIQAQTKEINLMRGWQNAWGY